MDTQFDSTSSRIITSPLDPWWDVPDSRSNLTKLVTSNAPTVDKITALARFLQLTGQTSQTDQWERLLEIAAIDIGVARMLEPHVDALGIIAEPNNLGLAADAYTKLFSRLNERPDLAIVVFH